MQNIFIARPQKAGTCGHTTPDDVTTFLHHIMSLHSCTYVLGKCHYVITFLHHKLLMSFSHAFGQDSATHTKNFLSCSAPCSTRTCLTLRNKELMTFVCRARRLLLLSCNSFLHHDAKSEQFYSSVLHSNYASIFSTCLEPNV